jgi:hypothetical protein
MAYVPKRHAIAFFFDETEFVSPYPYNSVIAYAGCEAGNELDVRDQFVAADTDEEAERQFDCLVQLCKSHVDRSARMINESDGTLTWTSPYTWCVVWIRMPKVVGPANDLSGKAAELDVLFPDGLGDYIVLQAGGGESEGGSNTEGSADLDHVWDTLKSNM